MPSELVEDVLSVEKQPTGRTLNRAINALMKNGVKTACDLTGLQAQLDFILHVLECHKNSDTRLSFDETKSLWVMLDCLQDAIRRKEEAVAVHVHTVRDNAFVAANPAAIGS